MVLSAMNPAKLCNTQTITIGPLVLEKRDRAGAIAMVAAALRHGSRLDIAICNAHTVLMALDHPSYADVLRRMTLLNDGVGVNLASRILTGSPFPDNLNGTDLVPAILANVEMPLRIYLLGATPSCVAHAARHIAQTHHRHEVVGSRDGYFADSDVDDVIETINAAKADLLLVAMGNPLQERFIVANRARLEATVCIGVGALFDFMTGRVTRAPDIMRAIGLEWLFRLAREPRRLGWRYFIGIPRFLMAIVSLRWREAGRERG